MVTLCVSSSEDSMSVLMSSIVQWWAIVSSTYWSRHSLENWSTDTEHVTDHWLIQVCWTRLIFTVTANHSQSDRSGDGVASDSAARRRQRACQWDNVARPGRAGPPDDATPHSAAFQGRWSVGYASRREPRRAPTFLRLYQSASASGRHGTFNRRAGIIRGDPVRPGGWDGTRTVSRLDGWTAQVQRGKWRPCCGIVSRNLIAVLGVFDKGYLDGGS